jgi:deoxyadenosine/deoxycytidine kinase
MTLFFENFILFLNVLEQFAIRVTIFGVDVEDLIKYVNKLYFRDTDDCIKDLIKKASLNSDVINPHLVVNEADKALDRKIINDILFEKLEYQYNVTNHVHFIY